MARSTLDRKLIVPGASSELEELASAIAEAHREVQLHLAYATRRAIDAGRALNRVKELLPHGEFGAWIAQNFAFTHRVAQIYMGLARMLAAMPDFEAKVSDEPLLGAHRLLREEFTKRYKHHALKLSEAETGIMEDLVDIGRQLRYARQLLPNDEHWHEWLDRLGIPHDAAAHFIDLLADATVPPAKMREMFFLPLTQDLTTDANAGGPRNRTPLDCGLDANANPESFLPPHDAHVWVWRLAQPGASEVAVARARLKSLKPK